MVTIMSRHEQVSSQRTPSTSVVVGGLMPHTEYNVTVQALTTGGTKEGPHSAPGETEMHHMHAYVAIATILKPFETKQSLYIDLLSHSELYRHFRHRSIYLPENSKKFLKSLYYHVQIYLYIYSIQLHLRRHHLPNLSPHLSSQLLQQPLGALWEGRSLVFWPHC